MSFSPHRNSSHGAALCYNGKHGDICLTLQKNMPLHINTIWARVSERASWWAWWEALQWMGMITLEHHSHVLRLESWEKSRSTLILLLAGDCFKKLFDFFKEYFTKWYINFRIHFKMSTFFHSGFLCRILFPERTLRDLTRKLENRMFLLCDFMIILRYYSWLCLNPYLSVDKNCYGLLQSMG